MVRSLLIASALSGCTCRPVAEGPDIVVIVMDTVRADRTSTFGYDEETTPNLTALAAQGVAYPNTWSTSGWTAPAHASLFTGLYPATHGTTQEAWTLASSHETLAEDLSAAGYATYAFVGNPMVGVDHRFDQGFDTFVESWRERGLRDPRTSDAVVELFATPSDRARFVFVNLIGAHTPYDSCGESCGAFGPLPNYGIVDSDWRDVYRGRDALSEAQLRRLRRLYDAEVLEVDRHLGRILDAVPDDAIVIVTSDHGENIGDHGHVNHVFSLYESTTHIPLVVRGVGTPGTVDTRPAQIVDAYATVRAVAGLPAKGDGVDLRALPDERAVLTEYYRPVQALERILLHSSEEEKALLTVWDRRIRTWTTDGYKLHWGDDGMRELYHLDADPDELSDLADAEPERVSAMSAALEAHVASLLGDFSPGTASAVIDDETRKALEELGYFE